MTCVNYHRWHPLLRNMPLWREEESRSCIPTFQIWSMRPRAINLPEPHKVAHYSCPWNNPFVWCAVGLYDLPNPMIPSRCNLAHLQNPRWPMDSETRLRTVVAELRYDVSKTRPSTRGVLQPSLRRATCKHKTYTQECHFWDLSPPPPKGTTFNLHGFAP